MRHKIIFSLCLATALTACTTESVMRPNVDVGMQTAALLPPAPISDASDFSGSSLAADEALPQSAPQQDRIVEGPLGQDTLIEEPARPTMIAAGLSRLVNPFGLGQGNRNSGMPASEVSCRKELRRLVVSFKELPAIQNGPSCSIPYPIEVSGLPGRAKLKPAATLNCTMALAFSKWVKHELQPAARVRYWSSVDTITQASAYSCRKMVGAGVDKMSEHSKGNALDIAKIELNNGKDILVRKKGFFAFRERGLLNTVREDGCSYFSTVLGPGYNKAHADHFHFDVMNRKSGYRACN